MVRGASLPPPPFSFPGLPRAGPHRVCRAIMQTFVGETRVNTGDARISSVPRHAQTHEATVCASLSSSATHPRRARFSSDSQKLKRPPQSRPFVCHSGCIAAHKEAIIALCHGMHAEQRVGERRDEEECCKGADKGDGGSGDTTPYEICSVSRDPRHATRGDGILGNGPKTTGCSALLLV